MSLAFVACVENGRLESQAILLCRSIRRNAGRFANAPIHTFQPRAGTAIGQPTLVALADLGVQHHADRLNADFSDYPIGNKIFVCAHAERNLSEDILVFLDSDTVFMNEPAAFELESSAQVALRPVDHKNRGSSGPGDAHDLYWIQLYELADVRRDRFINTAVSNERIRAFYNSGLLCARRSAGIFSAWKHCFLRLMQAKHVPDGQMTFMDQLALAATLSRLEDTAVCLLDPRYNYPLPKRPLLPAAMRYTLEDLVHVHYHRWFHRPGFLRAVRPPFDDRSEKFRWLERELPLKPLIDDPLRF